MQASNQKLDDQELYQDMKPFEKRAYFGEEIAPMTNKREKKRARKSQSKSGKMVHAEEEQ